MPSENKARGRVALIGRPNVGKSTLFNLLTRTRKAMVRNEPGVTRDILVEPADWWGGEFDVVDTGGLTEAKDSFSPLIREQVLSFISTFDVLIVVMDGRAGLVPEDREVVRIAKESGLPFLIAVNKIDRFHEMDLALSEFYEFGMDIVGAGFEKREGTDQIIEWILANLPEGKETEVESRNLAIVGKPNVGKSSLTNRILHQDRVLVSETAGTTVDAVELPFEYRGQNYTLVDTAGLRRPSKRKEGVEFLSAFKSKGAIEKADIVLLVVDATLGPTDQDLKLVDHILEQHKAVVLVANKIDLAAEKFDEPKKRFRELVSREFHFFPEIPIVFTSAKSGAGVDNLFHKINRLWNKLHIKIPTAKLNKFFYEVIRQAPAPVYGTQNVKFYYLTQTQQVPPSFIAFANHPEGVNPSYRRFLVNKIREEWKLEGVPIRIFVMKSGGR